MSVDFTLLIPEFLLAGLAIGVLAVDMVLPARLNHRRNAIAASMAAVGMLAVLGYSLVDLRNIGETLYGQIYFVDRYALLFKALFLGTGVAVVLMSVEYVGKKLQNPGEYYALLVFSVLGSIMMASAGELLTAYIALELLSFSLYALVGLPRGDHRSAEAVTKYILLGAVSSAILLYGISLLYGTLGTTFFRFMDSPLAMFASQPTVIIGFAMVAAGLAFKLAIVPFHMWTPDAYEGAPTPVTAHLSVLSKAAAFALALRFFTEATQQSFHSWQMGIAVLAALTMTVGALVALTQTNIKRLLAYSSITQAGFVIVGLVAIGDAIGGGVQNQAAANAVILHLVGYAFTTLAAFMVVVTVEAHSGRELIADYAGLARRSPLAAMVMASALLSLAGLPIFAGFVTKFFLFTAAAEAGLLWLVVVAALASLVSLYYYLRIVRQMYLVKPEGGSAAIVFPRLSTVTMLGLFGGMVFVGIYPGPILDAAEAATHVLGPFVSR